MGLDYMDLELTGYPVRRSAWGARTNQDGTPTVDREGLLAAMDPVGNLPKAS